MGRPIAVALVGFGLQCGGQDQGRNPRPNQRLQTSDFAKRSLIVTPGLPQDLDLRICEVLDLHPGTPDSSCCWAYIKEIPLPFSSHLSLLYQIIPSSTAFESNSQSIHNHGRDGEQGKVFPRFYQVERTC